MVRDRDVGHDVWSVRLPVGGVELEGDLTVPSGARGIAVFAHGSGSSRKSPRNRFVASVLNEGGLATLLFDLLTADEERVDLATAELRFDIGLLARRLIEVVDWLPTDERTRGLQVGLFGSSTGAAAALIAAAQRANLVSAVVSRGGRPDLAGGALPLVRSPTLLIIGGADTPVIALNREAQSELHCDNRIEIVPGATHLFEESGALEKVARLARDWLRDHLAHAEIRLPNGEPSLPGP